MASINEHNEVVVEVSDIRDNFPEFSDSTTYTDAMINSAISEAEVYVQTKISGDLKFSQRLLLIEYMACHVLFLNHKITASANSGGIAPVGQVASASIEQVHVSVAIPQNKNGLEYWLNQSPYGQRFLALLKALSSPFIVGGSLSRIQMQRG